MIQEDGIVLDRRGDVLGTALTADGVVADSRLGQAKHQNSIGEYKAKVIRRGMHKT